MTHAISMTACGLPTPHLPAELLIVYFAVAAALYIPGGDVLQAMIPWFCWTWAAPFGISESYDSADTTSPPLTLTNGTCLLDRIDGRGWVRLEFRIACVPVFRHVSAVIQ